MKTKVKPFVNLNVNPCKMCMPMGSVTALYGIGKCVSILHGSQGCSTYIRRHMATHYNEPVDIASSSLTEQGTVYGGEKNLKKGLKNLINVYQPSVVGVGTTCLAETIGEDIKRIIESFKEENPEYADIEIIPVNSAGYSGTQFEGYFRALYCIVSNVKMDPAPNKKINVITSILSPADTRYLKQVFALFGLDVILLPDLSQNLDGGHKETYCKLPEGGTPIEDIRKMAGAACTIEICNIELDESPGKYLEDTYGVSYRRLNLPIGLRDTDAFFDVLCEISGKEMPQEIKEQRYRYLDSMVDSHKYNSAGRAVVFGEPDQIISIVRLCAENGVVPVVAATGSKFAGFSQYVEEEIQNVADRYFVTDIDIKDDADFKDIEFLAEKNHANIMIGNSDGRRIEAHLGIPLVRRGFPIHDRVGGQRLRMLGYEGTLTLLDEITNAVLAKVETGFREEVFEKFYKGTLIDESEEVSDVAEMPQLKSAQASSDRQAELMKKTEQHPCYNCAGHKYARIHLPVAPRCNVQCNYCVRKFDCPNESRPGVTTQVLAPQEAFERYRKVKEKMPNLTVVGIAGPGDALANWEETRQTLELIREYDKDVTFCISTNGLLLPNYAEDLVRLGVSHVTVTINAVDPKISGRIYKHIDYMGNRFTGDSAGALMVSNQLNGIRILTAHGVVCKVNIVTLKGINDAHIPEIVKILKENGVFITNIMPHIHVEGSAFEGLPAATSKEVNEIRDECGKILKQMYHCRQCRADAVGTLDEDRSVDMKGFLAVGDSGEENAEPKEKAFRFAVASKNGSLVDLHFGQAEEFYIYDYKNGEVSLAERRSVDRYCNGKEDCDDEIDKIDRILISVSDCNGVLSMRVGEMPKKKLRAQGIKVITTYDKVDDAVKKAGDNY